MNRRTVQGLTPPSPDALPPSHRHEKDNIVEDEWVLVLISLRSSWVVFFFFYNAPMCVWTAPYLQGQLMFRTVFSSSLINWSVRCRDWSGVCDVRQHRSKDGWDVCGLLLTFLSGLSSSSVSPTAVGGSARCLESKPGPVHVETRGPSDGVRSPPVSR